MYLPRTIVAICALFAHFQASLAQQSAIQIWTPPDAQEQPIRLRSMDINAKSYGFIASTRIELEFFNPNNRIMEGEFVFPLLPGQTVAGYALEVAGVLRAGVVVPKETARAAFEEVTRRRVDPGLAELTRGNVFRTRVYPIPARGSKRIAITIEQALDQIDGKWRYRFAVPATGKLADYRVRFEAIGMHHASSNKSLALQDAKVAQRHQQNVVPEKLLTFDVPEGSSKVYAVPAPILSAEKSASAWPLSVAQVIAPTFKPTPIALPKTVAVYMDASRSTANVDHAKIATFLQALFKQIGEADVQLVVFRDRALAPLRFAIQKGNSTALLQAISALDHDGGTSIDALAFDVPADLAIVLTDGAANFEPAVVQAQTPRAKQHVIAWATETVDAKGVARLAQRLSATKLNLLEQLPQAQVVQALLPTLSAQAKLASGQCAREPLIEHTVRGRARLIAQCEVGSTIEVVWVNASQTQRQQVTIPAVLNLSDADVAPIQRLWAATQIRALELTKQPDQKRLLGLATAYSVVTEQTSMLVLDSIEDYLRYDVMPLEADLREDFLTRRSAQINQDSDAKPDYSELIAQWQEFKRHHETGHGWINRVIEPLAMRVVKLARETKQKSLTAKAIDLQRKAQKLIAAGNANGPRGKIVFADILALETRVISKLPQAQKQALLAAREQAASYSEVDDMALDQDSEVLESVLVTGSRIQRSTNESAAPAAASAPESVNGYLDSRAAPKPATAESSEPGPGQTTQASAEIKAYVADSPYLARMRTAQDPYQIYLTESLIDGSVGFYLDCAEFFRSERKNPELALRVLSNIAEVQVDSVDAVRVLAETLRQWQRWDFALAQFEIAQQLRLEEPQGYRDLALSLARAPRAAGGDVKRALSLLWYVASHEWDTRFDSIQLTALHEFNDVLATASTADRSDLRTLGVPNALIGTVPVGLRVVLGWNANDVDIDLWVRDPVGEWAYYSQRQTRTGGQMSDDFTEGYGPETFTISKPLPGTYTVFAHYYGNHQQKLAVPISVYLEFQTPFGAGGSKRTSTVRRLDTSKEHIEIGSFTVD